MKKELGWKYPALLAVSAVAALVGFSTSSHAEDVKVTLSGSQEVPPVTTSATGTGTLTIKDDKTVSGTITTTGIKGTAAHIHAGAPGKNGGVAVPLKSEGTSGWSVPANTKLTDAQYKQFKAGELYVNVHSDAHKNGEIRAQLKP
jgi:hypothetical protein